MRIVFAADVLADPQHSLDLYAILAKVADGWHVLDVPDPEGLEASAFFRGNPHIQLLQKAAQSAAWRPWSLLHLRCVLVTTLAADVPVEPPEMMRLAPVEARRFLDVPLRILLENRHTDGRLVDIVIDLFANHVLQDLRRRNVITYDSPGGAGEIPKTLEDDAQRDFNLVKRTIVMTDSDAPAPGRLEAHAVRIRQRCDELAVPCVVLSQRSIENYLPDEVLMAWAWEPETSADKRRTVDALTRLTVEQRDHFHMKRGLPNLWRDEDGSDLAQRALYATVHEDDRQALQRGLGNDIFEEAIFTDRQTAPRRPEATREAFRARDTHGDLERLARLIEAWL